jgi:hypothetical protein
MVSSGILRRVALVGTDVSEDLSAAFIRVTGIGELGRTAAVTSNRHTLLGISSQCASVASYSYRRPYFIDISMLNCQLNLFIVIEKPGD